MKEIRRYLIAMTVFALVIAGAGYANSGIPIQTFVSNFLLNLAAGFLGVVVGVVLGVRVATLLAQRKLDELAPRFVDLIKQLWTDRLISSEVARASVICTVGLISEASLQKARKAARDSVVAPCAVCSLESRATPDIAGVQRCSNCGLEGAVWVPTARESKAAVRS